MDPRLVMRTKMQSHDLEISSLLSGVTTNEKIGSKPGDIGNSNLDGAIVNTWASCGWQLK